MKMSKTCLQGFVRTACCVAVVALGTLANADTIGSWALFGEPGNQVFSPGVGSPNVTATNMVRGAGLTGNAGGNSFNSAGWTSEATDYMEFGLSIDPGYQVALDDLIIGTRASNTGPGFVGVYSSLDGFSSPITTLVQSGTNFLNSVIDLSSLGTVSGPFSIRLAQIGTTSANGGSTSASGTFRITDYFDGTDFSDTQITGVTSAVPEPSTVLLLGLGGMSLFLLKRRRAR